MVKGANQWQRLFRHPTIAKCLSPPRRSSPSAWALTGLGAFTRRSGRAAGTVAPAQRYVNSQVSDKDVTLGDTSVPELMQTDAFEAMVKDPDFRKLARDPELPGARAKSGGAVGARRECEHVQGDRVRSDALRVGRAIGAAAVAECRRTQRRQRSRDGARDECRLVQDAWLRSRPRFSGDGRSCATFGQLLNHSEALQAMLKNPAGSANSPANARRSSMPRPMRRRTARWPAGQGVREPCRRCEGDGRASGRRSFFQSLAANASSFAALARARRTSTPRSTATSSTRWSRTLRLSRRWPRTTACCASAVTQAEAVSSAFGKNPARASRRCCAIPRASPSSRRSRTALGVMAGHCADLPGDRLAWAGVPGRCSQNAAAFAQFGGNIARLPGRGEPRVAEQRDGRHRPSRSRSLAADAEGDERAEGGLDLLPAARGQCRWRSGRSRPTRTSRGRSTPRRSRRSPANPKAFGMFAGDAKMGNAINAAQALTAQSAAVVVAEASTARRANGRGLPASVRADDAERRRRSRSSRNQPTGAGIFLGAMPLLSRGSARTRTSASWSAARRSPTQCTSANFANAINTAAMTA